MKIKISILFILINMANMIHCQNWKGFGNGIGSIDIENKTINYITNQGYEGLLKFESLREGKIDCKSYDILTWEYKYDVKIEVFGNIDSLHLLNLNGKHIFSFYDRNSIPYETNFDFEEFELRFFEDGIAVSKTIRLLNNNKLIINQKDSIKSFTITDQQIEEFRSLIKHLDVKGLNDSHVWRNICFGTEHGFKFTSKNGEIYDFISLHIPTHLKAIFFFINELVEKTLHINQILSLEHLKIIFTCYS